MVVPKWSRSVEVSRLKPHEFQLGKLVGVPVVKGKTPKKRGRPSDYWNKAKSLKVGTTRERADDDGGKEGALTLPLIT